ncbi:MAG: hypothetical protein AB1679_09895 [Actinomycetota bacterium]
MALSPGPAQADVIARPAPPGQASAVAARAGSVFDVSKTGATADQSGPSAEASVLRIQGKPVHNLGGTQNGNGRTGGALADTGANHSARVEVAPWQASVEGAGGPTRQATSSAALLRVTGPNEIAAGVLASKSEASHSDQESGGTATSDGVDLRLGSNRVVLLHSEVTSEAKGRSYLLGLNDTKIGTDDQLGKSPLCAANAPNLLALSCLTASGGVAANGVTNAAAEVAKVNAAIEAIKALNPVAAFTTTAASGGGATVSQSAAIPAAAANEASRDIAAPAAGTASPAPATPGGTLPRTGTSAASVILAATAALLGGLALRRFRPTVIDR